MRKAPVSLAYFQLGIAIVPLQLDGAVFSFLVVVVGAFVFVERECNVATRIDAQINRVRGLFGRELLLWTEGKNRPCRNEERNLIELRADFDASSTGKMLAGPEVEPPIFFDGQVDTCM